MALSIDQRANLDMIKELNEYETILDSSDLTLLLHFFVCKLTIYYHNVVLFMQFYLFFLFFYSVI